MCAPLSTLALSLLKKVKVHNKDVSPKFPETPDMLDALKIAAIASLNGRTVVKQDKVNSADSAFILLII